jgi:hypothetical protein
MGKSKKPSRKDDVKKARSYHMQYVAHQEKLRHDPGSIAAEHWRKEKKNFLSRVNYYYSRAGVKNDDILD